MSANVDAPVVYERLRLIRSLLDDLDQIGDLSASDLNNDRIRRHAVERIITQVIELAVSINGHVAAATVGRGPSTYRASFSDAADAAAISKELADQLAPAAGLRNVLTHGYVTIDLDKVAQAIPEVRSGFRDYVTAIAQYLKTREAVPPGTGGGNAAEPGHYSGEDE